MKKIFLALLSIITFFSCLFSSVNIVKATELDLNSNAVCLIEPISKNVIYAKNEKEKLFPASMTKMMGLYLILEAIEEGRISFEDQVIISSYASSMGGTQVFLEENEKMCLEDLFKSVCINSANDAIVALGEHLAGSNNGFVEMMNNKAKEFNMLNTNFVNATGFDDENHYTCAYDMALLGSYLVSFGDKILKYTSMQEGYIREDTKEPFWLVNTNKLLKYYDGLDGLKTGFTQKAGYNLTATASRNGVRLVSTVMKEDTIAHRSQDTIRLLDYGFSLLKAKCLYSKDDIVSTFVIDESLNKYLQVTTNSEVKIIFSKNENENDIQINAVLEKIDCDYKCGDLVGYLEVITPSGSVYKYNLYAHNEVSKPNFITYLFNVIMSMFL